MLRPLPRTRRLPTHHLGLSARELGPALLAPFHRSNGLQARFERLWAGRFPDRRTLPMPLGRHALWFFLEAAGLEPGDEVLVPAYNYYVIVRLLLQRGLVPVFVDVEADTACLDPIDLARKVSPRSRMVLATHIFGHPANISEIARICAAHELLLFEDCAHALGTTYEGTQVGSFGNGSLFSFGIWKLISSFGGGMLVCDDELYARLGRAALDPRASLWRDFSDLAGRFMIALSMRPGLYGFTAEPMLALLRRLDERGSPGLRQQFAPNKDDPDYRFDPNERSGYHPFMSATIEAQLERLEARIAARRTVVDAIEARLAELPELRLLAHDRHGRANASYLGVWAPDSEALARSLEARGIGCNPHEFFDCGRLAQFAPFAAHNPVAAEISDHVIRLPSYADMSERDIDALCGAIEHHYRARSGGARHRRDSGERHGRVHARAWQTSSQS